ncbi:sensor histidine kinase [Hymenobacter chitinivorans]|uniref:Histidine kinase n=1 Tax=Hymenobacter chitinivorans DSM 11115 TaxID=1121954 RepID=A0A2M9BMS2_9BACT|nr:histidine kinase [Hymenobacter chitinivorans]PJJ59235.1 histidine kinase [Hymenobacter chitinivorans DSM 11115]
MPPTPALAFPITPPRWLPAASRVPLWAHLSLWVGLVAIDALQIYFGLHALSRPNASPTFDWRYALVHGVLTDILYAGFFYFNWLILIPNILAHNQVWRYVLAVVVTIAVSVGLRLLISRYTIPSGGAEPINPSRQTEPYILWGLITLFFSSGLKVTSDYLQGQRNRRELEHQNLLTELALLKAQVNPHFLFNTLNNIYSLTKQQSARAPEAVLRLSEIMRYMLYESNAEQVLLQKELANIRSFLDLQRLRLPGEAATAVAFQEQGTAADPTYLIAPMLLLPLVENAFKHGDLSVRPQAVRLAVELSEAGELRFSVHNFVDDQAQPPAGQPGGLGLVNLRRRLNLLYPNRHTLTVDRQPQEHTVVLTLAPPAPTAR